MAFAVRTSHRSVIWYCTGINASGFWQWRLWNSRCLRGQYIHWYCDRKLVSATAASMVPTAPPTKPSTVFFGESFIKGVLPNVLPAHHTAHTSSHCTEGRLGWGRPSRYRGPPTTCIPHCTAVLSPVQQSATTGLGKRCDAVQSEHMHEGAGKCGHKRRGSVS